MLQIPVIFNLSSWTVKQPSLEEWLIEEFRTKYYIPKKVAQAWIRDDALLLLLDGLDEVSADARDKCVAVINAFQEQHIAPLAVCSRTADYEILTTKLHLQDAIRLRPLIPEQADAYLADRGTELQAVRDALRHDPVLQEMAQYPLFLSIIPLAYSDLASTDLQTLTTPQARRQHLFDTYIERMFQRRAKDMRYTPKQTRCWLSWLAGQLSLDNQTVFLIENLQPDWLPARAQRLARGFVMLIVSLIFGLLMALVTNPPYILAGGLSLALSEWIISLMNPEAERWSWRRAAIGFGSGVLGGLVTGLVEGIVAGWGKEGTWIVWLGAMVVMGLFDGLIVGLFAGLVEGMIGGLHNVRGVETLKWSWRHAALWLGIGSGVGMVLGLLFGLSVGMGIQLIFGLILGASTGLGSGLIGGFHSADIQFKTRPNEGIRQSAKNAVVIVLVAGLVAGPAVGLIVGLVKKLSGGQFVWLPITLVFGLAFGLIGGLIQGGKASIFHYTLRTSLARTGRLPWRLVPFLDHCVERIFLRRVGGGYIFVHRLLQEHFTSLTTENTEHTTENKDRPLLSPDTADHK
jgi:hypothetical protein